MAAACLIMRVSSPDLFVCFSLSILSFLCEINLNLSIDHHLFGLLYVLGTSVCVLKYIILFQLSMSAFKSQQYLPNLNSYKKVSD